MAPSKPARSVTSTSKSSHKPTPKKPAPSLPLIRKPKKEKPMKQIFRGLCMSITGTMLGVGSEPLTHEKIGDWIRAHGGRVERQVSGETTHLICDVEEFRRGNGNTLVKAAWALGTKQCAIVTLDWLTDCLRGKKDAKRLLNSKPYTLDRVVGRLKKGDTDMVKYRLKFQNGVRVSKELSDSSLYHVYYDTDAFEYKVLLTRCRRGLNKYTVERYTLFLFESHSRAPPLYMFGAKYSRPSLPASYYRQDCRPMEFSTAFYCFRKFFREKTGVEWDERLERRNSKVDEMGREVDFFKYSPPIRGRPVGLLPWGYVRPEDRVGVVMEGEGVAYDTESEADSEEEGGGTSLVQRGSGGSANRHSSLSSSEGDYETASEGASSGDSTSLMRPGSSGGESSSSDSGGGQRQPGETSWNSSEGEYDDGLSDESAENRARQGQMVVNPSLLGSLGCSEDWVVDGF